MAGRPGNAPDGRDAEGREMGADRNVSRLDAATAERLLAGDDVGFADLSRLLAAASSPARPQEMAGETEALVAFRYATLGAPGEPRRRSTAKPMWARLASVKVAAIAVALATTGVALAAGTGVLPTPFTADPPTTAPDLTASRPGGGNPGGNSPTTTGALGGPGAVTTGPAPSTPPHPSHFGLCRQYRERAERNPDKALDPPAFVPLIEAAGGRDKVDGYCDQILGDKKNNKKDDGDEPPRQSDDPTGPPPSPGAANTPTAPQT
jgi:hypothetical protein